MAASFLGSILILAVFLISFDGFLIKDIRISGVETLDANLIRSVSEEALSNRRFLLVAGENTLFLSKKKLEEALFERFPRIDDVDIKRKGFSTLTIVVGEEEGNTLWCHTKEDDLASDTSKKCFFINKDGKLFAKGPVISNQIFFEIYTETFPKGSGAIGNYVTSSAVIERAAFIRELLSRVGIIPESLLVGQNGRRELVTSNGMSIIYTEEQEITELLENIESILESKIFVDQELTYDDIAYIDLRFGKKAYYRLK